MKKDFEDRFFLLVFSRNSGLLFKYAHDRTNASSDVYGIMATMTCPFNGNGLTLLRSSLVLVVLQK